jgi:hypothetical protein
MQPTLPSSTMQRACDARGLAPPPPAPCRAVSAAIQRQAPPRPCRARSRAAAPSAVCPAAQLQLWPAQTRRAWSQRCPSARRSRSRTLACTALPVVTALAEAANAAGRSAHLPDDMAWPLLCSTIAGLSTSIGGAIAVTLAPDARTLAFLLGIGVRGARARVFVCVCGGGGEGRGAPHAVWVTTCSGSHGASVLLAVTGRVCVCDAHPLSVRRRQPPPAPLPPTATGVMATVSLAELWWHTALQLHDPAGISAAVAAGAGARARARVRACVRAS